MLGQSPELSFSAKCYFHRNKLSCKEIQILKDDAVTVLHSLCQHICLVLPAPPRLWSWAAMQLAGPFRCFPWSTERVLHKGQFPPSLRLGLPSKSQGSCVSYGLPLQPSPGLRPFPPGPAGLLTSFAGADPPPQAAIQKLVCPRRAGPCHQSGSGFM